MERGMERVTRMELDARTIYDIACIRADRDNATREDMDFKAIALRNYNAVIEMLTIGKGETS